MRLSKVININECSPSTLSSALLSVEGGNHHCWIKCLLKGHKTAQFRATGPSLVRAELQGVSSPEPVPHLTYGPAELDQAGRKTLDRGGRCGKAEQGNECHLCSHRQSSIAPVLDYQGIY